MSDIDKKLEEVKKYVLNKALKKFKDTNIECSVWCGCALHQPSIGIISLELRMPFHLFDDNTKDIINKYDDILGK